MFSYIHVGDFIFEYLSLGADAFEITRVANTRILLVLGKVHATIPTSSFLLGGQ